MDVRRDDILVGIAGLLLAAFWAAVFWRLFT
jgi:hypothetical protein